MSLEDIREKGFKITLDKERTLLFDLNAFADIEEKYGSFDKAIDKLEKGSIKALRALLWAGLTHEDETLTERQVGGMINVNKMEEVSKALVGAIGQNTPQPEEPKGNVQVGKK
jgi:hypothetical protein